MAPLVPLLPGFSLPGERGPAGTAGLDFDAGVQPPEGWAQRFTYRQFASQMSANDELLANLVANPAVRASTAWVDTQLEVMVQDTDAPRLAELDTVMATAVGLTMYPYPGLRLLPSAGTVAQWTTSAYWDVYEAKVQTLLAHRLSGDPRIAFDLEAYSGGDEMTRFALTGGGKTLQDFIDASQGFFDMLLAASPLPVIVVYPAVLGDLDHLNIFIERCIALLGPTRVEVVWETQFNMPELYRKDPHGTYVGSLSFVHAERSKFEVNLGLTNLRHRLMIYEEGVQYVWGQKWRSEVADAVGPIRCSLFDLTRANRTSWGTTNGYNGVALDSLNDLDYCWCWVPTYKDSQTGNITSSGNNATQLTTNLSRDDATTTADGYSTLANIDGMLLRDPAFGGRHASVRIEGVLPSSTSAAWTIDFSVILSATDTSTDYPIISSAQYNSNCWQVYRKASDNKLYLQVNRPANPPDHFDLGITTTPGENVRIQIGRSAQTWLYTAGSAAINRTLLGYTVPAMGIGLLKLCAGAVVSSFPTQDTQFGIPNLMLPATTGRAGTIQASQLHVWKSRLLSDAEINRLRGKHWPFSRAT